MRRALSGFMLASLLIVRGPAGICPAQEKPVEPSLDDLVDIRGWTVFNRVPHPLNDEGRKGVRFDERKGGGMAWYPEIVFSNGEIEFDARGKNVPQKSFVGVMFHGVNERTYDAVYFRAFNFKSPDSLARTHAVQYISPPEYGWKDLREKHTGVYEHAVLPVPDPDGWFHVKVVVAYPAVKVYLNGAAQPCLVVNKLNDRRSGWVGLWVGDDSGGDFANFRITPAGD